MNSGIYQIINLLTKNIYIGSSKDLIRREKDHFRLLKLGKSHCRLLQRAVNKYGIKNFKFEILLFCEISKLFDTEQELVDALNPRYNICKTNVSVPTGIIKSDEAKRKIGESNKFKDNPNFGWKSKIILKLDNNGSIIKEYKSLTEYALEHNCAIGNVGKALKENNKCKGFHIKYKEQR